MGEFADRREFILAGRIKGFIHLCLLRQGQHMSQSTKDALFLVVAKKVVNCVG
jgi:hypothetical protein